MSIRTLIIAALVAIATWYSLKTYSAYQTLTQLHACGKELDLSRRIKAAKSPAEQREVMIMEIECMDRKLGFPASLFFDKSESIASIEFHAKATVPDRGKFP